MKVLAGSDRLIDVERASRGRFPADPAGVFDRWDEFRRWAETAPTDEIEVVERSRYGAPAPSPRQVFAVGLNYAAHADEAGAGSPAAPQIFTKFPSSLTGPFADLELPEGDVDWEVELVVVIGRTARETSQDRAWEHVAGLTVGQDFSERRSQLVGAHPQYSLAKSHPGFSPTGPVLVTPDEFDDPSDVAIECLVNGETMQRARTSQLTFGVAELIAHLSAVCTLYPGDLLFTGTPSGVGLARTPPRFLAPGDTVSSRAEGIGEIHQVCHARSHERPEVPDASGARVPGRC